MFHCFLGKALGRQQSLRSPWGNERRSEITLASWIESQEMVRTQREQMLPTLCVWNGPYPMCWDCHSLTWNGVGGASRITTAWTVDGRQDTTMDDIGIDG